MNDFVRERVSRCNLGTYLPYGMGWVMRVWREGLSDGDYIPGHTQIDSDVANVLTRFVSLATRPLDIGRAVLALERVRAVELIDMQGFGEKLTKKAEFVPFARTSIDQPKT